MNIKYFQAKVLQYKRRMNFFLTRLEKRNAKGLDAIVASIEKDVWQQVDCTSCANCCKVMTPTFTPKDIKRIAAYLQMTTLIFKEKFLHYVEKDKDWQSKKQPCQWLEKTTNRCSIYEVRPADCAGFPHLTKKKFVNYIHVHKQNIAYCPATYKMVEKMMELKLEKV